MERVSETYIQTIIRAINSGSRCISGPCELCGGKTVAWTESSIEPTCYYHILLDGKQHKIDSNYLNRWTVDKKGGSK